MNVIKQITVILCILTASNASLIGDFLAGAKSFWPKSKGNEKVKCASSRSHGNFLFVQF